MKVNTKNAILSAALTSFLEKGFAGASISQIARKAEINQSLIYHYFQSKEDLWRHVKKHCINEVLQDVQSIRLDNLEHFLHDLIEARFFVYEKTSMRKLAHWQALEPDTAKFYPKNGIPHALFDINHHLIILQKNKIIRADQDPQILSSVIFSLMSYAFFDFANAFNLSELQCNKYKELTFTILKDALKPRDANEND